MINNQITDQYNKKDYLIKLKKINYNKLFMPEELSPLYYTDSYLKLSPEARLRYNQLNTLYCNEQIYFFERTLSVFLISSAKYLPIQLANQVEKMVKEELVHADLFYKLNMIAAPEYYKDNKHFFINLSIGLKKVFHMLMLYPRFFPFFIWIIMLMEEKAVFHSLSYSKHKNKIEENFLEIYFYHLEDEESHLSLGKDLETYLWKPRNSLSKKINAKMFSIFINNFFSSPGKSSAKIIDTLLAEDKISLAECKKIKYELSQLKNNLDYRLSQFSPQICPNTYTELRSLSEFDLLINILPKYNVYD